MRHYCSIFDKNYLIQGMTVYRSLENLGHEFVYYVLCMDEVAYELLKNMRQENLVPIYVDELNNEETLPIRAKTSRGQYCWVSQPLICRYLLDHYQLDMITYLEADSMFFASPEYLFEELGNDSVSLVPHRYTPEYDQTEKSGKYCVQFNAFKNDERAKTVLDYWKTWCFKYDKNNPGYYPGQINLDQWRWEFDGVKEIEHLGAGLAPWNVQQYKLEKKDKQILVNGQPLVFYHYHQFAFFDDGDLELGFYPLSDEVIELIYKPYVEELAATQDWIKTYDPDFNYLKTISKPVNLIGLMLKPSYHKLKEHYWQMKRRKLGIYNVYKTL